MKMKILVSYKDRHTVLKSDIVTPIQTGRAIADKIFEDMIGDDIGDNISSKNLDYGELTAQYWAWKNYDKLETPNYIGFMHYRRIFNFTQNKISFFDELDFSSAYCFCKDYDIIVSEKLPAYSPKMKKNAKDIKEQWNAEFNLQDLELVMNIIKKEYPEMVGVVDKYLSASTAYWYNIFIMKKETFMEYSQWLFDILKQCEGKVFGDRAVGMLGERIMNIFIEYKRLNGAKIVEVPLFRPHEVQYTKDDLIPVVLISSNAYIRQTSATILSVIKNCRHPERLKFLILSSDISSKNKSRCLKFFKGYNIKILDIQNSWLEKYAGIAIPAHVSESTFARLLAPKILSTADKIIYIDADVLVRKDILDLYNVDMSDYPLALCEDVANSQHSKRLKTDNYYNCGIMLFNTKKYLPIYNSDQLWQTINQHRHLYRICDQDFINDGFRGKILYLNPTWNFHYLKHPVLNLYKPQSEQDYKTAEKNPAIIHFVGPDKPWYPSCKHAYKREYLSYFNKINYETKIFRKEKYKDRDYNHSYVLFGNIPIFHIAKKNTVIKKYVLGVPVIKIQKKRKYKKVCVLGIPVYYKKNKEAVLAEKKELLEFVNKKMSSLETLLAAQNIHPKTFTPYKNAFAGKDIVLVCTGPTAKYYQPIKNAIHVGVNGAIYLEQVKLDYLFMQDYTVNQASNSNLNIDGLSYKGNHCKKFWGILPNSKRNELIERIPLSYSYGDDCFQYVLEGEDFHNIAYDLSREPIGQFEGTTFSALQFILYTHPKRLFLVGWDCGAGYAYNQKNALSPANYQIKILEKYFVPFIRLNYPDIEIISVNPVGLKNIFIDKYSKNYLEEYPEINSMEIIDE